MEQYTVVKKAYEIKLDKLSEGYLSTPIVCHAENINEAKQILLAKIRIDGWELITGEEITYLNIPVVRSKEHDFVMFENEEVLRNEIEGIKRKKVRAQYLDSVLNDPNIKYCYIRKGSYYCPNCCGYTQYKFYAGVYTKERAVQEARSVGDVTVEPINIEEHNAMIIQKIADLETRIIN